MPTSATLGDLPEIIQIAVARYGGHLHTFTVGVRRYGDQYFDAEYDEYKITLDEPVWVPFDRATSTPVSPGAADQVTLPVDVAG